MFFSFSFLIYFLLPLTVAILSLMMICCMISASTTTTIACVMFHNIGRREDA